MNDACPCCDMRSSTGATVRQTCMTFLMADCCKQLFRGHQWANLLFIHKKPLRTSLRCTLWLRWEGSPPDLVCSWQGFIWHVEQQVRLCFEYFHFLLQLYYKMCLFNTIWRVQVVTMAVVDAALLLCRPALLLLSLWVEEHVSIFIIFAFPVIAHISCTIDATFTT